MKDLFPYFQHHPDLVYLDSAATAHKPLVMIDAINSFYREEYATVHRAVYSPSLKASESYYRCREKVQQFLGAAFPEEIIFTRGTTDAINLVARSFGPLVVGEGDEILITEMEHHSNLVPWQMLAAQTKATLRWMKVSPNGTLEWEGTLSPRTKIVALSHMSNVTGTINPIQEIIRKAHSMGAFVVIDGAQSAPHIRVDVQLLDPDFYAFSGHKCYGPTGVGVLYGKKALLEQMPPLEGGGDMIERVEMEKTTYQKSPLRFEAGTPIIGSVIALKSALDFIDAIGMDAICAHEQSLLHLATDRVKGIEGLRILGTAPDKGPILTFSIDGVHPLDLATFLDLDRIAIRSGHLCAQPLLRVFGLESVARASFAVYNTEEDIDCLIKSLVKAIATLRK